MGCVLLVVMVILTAVVIAMCRKRFFRGRKIGECVLLPNYMHACVVIALITCSQLVYIVVDFAWRVWQMKLTRELHFLAI